MRMAKASQADLDMSIKLSELLQCLESGYLPAENEGDEETEFDLSDPKACQSAMKRILSLQKSANLPRVTWGMVVLLDPQNEIVDPDVSFLQLHPKHSKETKEQGSRIQAT